MAKQPSTLLSSKNFLRLLSCFTLLGEQAANIIADKKKRNMLLMIMLKFAQR
jgi:hypothetical protein